MDTTKQSKDIAARVFRQKQYCMSAFINLSTVKINKMFF
ncbi:hypothetical protein RintRC_5047 [Richelia intracellularis]|nr:hypothetical protein RintRC_5047 [Richelia intracellularis]